MIDLYYEGQKCKLVLIFFKWRGKETAESQIGRPRFERCRASGPVSSGDIIQSLFRKTEEKKRRE